MKNIIISPYSKPLRNGKENPKNYPYWSEVVTALVADGYSVSQLQFKDEKVVESCKSVINYTSLRVIETLVDTYDFFVSIDNFLPHLAHVRKKYGVVIWGKSDPLLFGYPENTNLLKDRNFLRKRQFDIWEAEEFDPSVFVDSQIVVEAIQKFGLSHL